MQIFLQENEIFMHFFVKTVTFLSEAGSLWSKNSGDASGTHRLSCAVKLRDYSALGALGSALGASALGASGAGAGAGAAGSSPMNSPEESCL